MVFKKSKGKIFGVELTANERKAMDLEIRRQLVEYNQKNINELDALVLWHLHSEFGFGKKRLMKFYNTFSESVKEVCNYYLMEADKIPWVYSKKLKDYGIDIETLE